MEDLYAELVQMREENARQAETIDLVRRNFSAVRRLLRRIAYDSPLGPAILEAAEAELARRDWTPEQVNRVRLSLKPVMYFSWVVPGKLAGCALPDTAVAIRALADAGVRALVSLTEEVPPAELLRNAGIHGFHIQGVRDMGAPTTEQLADAVGYIEASLRAGRPVAVHCEAGRGRTGTVLAAYFVAQGMPADEAIRHVRELRPDSVESIVQENAVRSYARSLSATGHGK